MGMTAAASSRGKLSALLIASAFLLTQAVATPSAYAFQAGGQFASTVIGQANFVASARAATQNNFYRPYGAAFDSSGDLWVADENNNRVVEFKPPFSDGESASLVLGHPGFTSGAFATTQSGLWSPVGLTFDSSGDLWVADSANNRVLEFKPPFTDGMNASLELGQPAGSEEFVSNSPSAGPNGLDFPLDMTFDSSGNLWVSDHQNNRVLEFKPPFTDGMDASMVIGQTNTTAVPVLLSASQSTLFGPNGLAFDSSGDLWVADENHNRVLEFAASSLGSNDPQAALEIGQPAGTAEFSSSIIADNRSGFDAPLSLAFDSSGDLWVSDRADNRVLEFKPPFTDGMNASNEVGQPAGPDEFTDNSTALTQSAFRNPLGIAFDSSGDLWVADQLNNRVLEFSGAATATAAVNVDIPTTTAQSGVSISSSGNACYQTGEQNVCHLVANETSTTGVDVDMIGVASASTANVYSADFGSQEPSYAQGGQDPISSPIAFYGVTVSGIGSGTATVCVDQRQVQSSTQMAYFSGSAWATPTIVSRSIGASVCGTIPISAISSGQAVVAIGASNRPAAVLGALNPFAYLLLIFGAILICGYAVVARRRGREAEADEDLDEEEF